MKTISAFLSEELRSVRLRSDQFMINRAAGIVVEEKTLFDMIVFAGTTYCSVFYRMKVVEVPMWVRTRG